MIFIYKVKVAIVYDNSRHLILIRRDFFRSSRGILCFLKMSILQKKTQSIPESHFRSVMGIRQRNCFFCTSKMEVGTKRLQNFDLTKGQKLHNYFFFLGKPRKVPIPGYKAE